MQTNLLQNLFLLLPFTYQLVENDIQHDAATHWNHEDNGADWEGTCALGQRQSPIRLSSDNSAIFPILPIIFHNYNAKLKGPLQFLNKGYTVDMAITETVHGNRPYITGGILKGQYVAEGVHFHWGSPSSSGAEHTINGKHYSGEMHIVHRNKKYNSIDEAVQYSDGIAVLGVFLKITHLPDRIFPGLRKLLALAVPKITKYHAVTEIPGYLSLGQLLGDLNTNDFYTYKGSLTTPDCNEAVTWTVFTQPLPIPYSDMSNLWKLRDSNGNFIRNNYRFTQPQNKRIVLHRKSIRG